VPDRQGQVAAQYHTARFRLVPQLAKALSVPVPALRKPGSAWTELPRLPTAGAVGIERSTSRRGVGSGRVRVAR
jgi:hypothetical protein